MDYNTCLLHFGCYKVLTKISVGCQQSLCCLRAAVEQSNNLLIFQFEIFSHPIFSKDGNYPAVVRERVDRNSFREGRNHSRLPYFTDEEVDYIRGTKPRLSIYTILESYRITRHCYRYVYVKHKRYVQLAFYLCEFNVNLTCGLHFIVYTL